MVERIEGFCSEAQWRRAYDEINSFERRLHEWGAIVQKFWLQIDKEEQLQRFRERESTPEKQYKITEADWRNRAKWDDYETAVDDMLQRRNTAWAPWTVVESNSKYYARIKVLKTVIKAIEERL
jgi:polyphosphate kinase 2 (PPK2 family)